MKYYYALFKNTQDVVEVEFPDLAGCATFGKDWEDAFDKAEDALAAWLSHAAPKFIKKPSKHHELSCNGGELVPIPVNEKIKVAYQQRKRFNVIFSTEVFNQIDIFRKKIGLKRSAFLQKAAEEYLQKHA
jgi:predicted RNase H-like HicB family nuclease